MKRMTRTLITLIMALTMVLTLTACGEKSPEQEPADIHTGQHTLALTDTAGTEIIFEKAE